MSGINDVILYNKRIFEEDGREIEKYKEKIIVGVIKVVVKLI